MINFEKFFESNEPNLDFLIDTTNNSRIRSFLESLNFRCFEFNGVNLFYNKITQNPARGDILFSGFSYTDKSIIKGPIISNNIDFDASGNFISIEITQKAFVVRNDLFGLSPIYFGKGLIANRLQLIFLVLKEIGDLSLNNNYTLTPFLLWNAFSQQIASFQTILSGIRKLQQNKFLIASQNSIQEETDALKDVPFSEQSSTTYHTYLLRAADDIVKNLTKIISFDRNSFLAVTGGKDSRVLYAALVSMGKINDVQIITNDVGRDRYISTGLVQKFGGHFGFPEEESLLYSSLSNNFDHYFSHYFFNKINIPDIYIRENMFLSNKAISLIGGYGGEVYYDFYQNIGIRFQSEKYSENELISMLKANSFSEITEKDLADITNTFSNLQGRTWSQKLASHYLEFRNTFHFGSRINKLNQIDFSPLVSRNLFLASRCLPDAVRDTSRITFDLTKIFSEEIAYSQYENVLPDYSKIPYNKHSKYDGIILPLQPNLSLIKYKKLQIPQISTKPLFQEKVDFLTKLLAENKANGFIPDINGKKHTEKIVYFMRKKSPNIDKYITAVLMSLFYKLYNKNESSFSR